MVTEAQRVRQAARFLSGLTDARPAIGLLTGTGLEACTGALDPAVQVDYADIPHFPRPTVEGHPGRLVLGRIGTVPVAAFGGRFHLYEGHSPRRVVFPIRVMRALGVTTVIITNAAGGLNPIFSPGDIMIVVDHLNLTGASPLIGPNDDEWGIRFPDMGRAYTPGLADLAEEAGAATGARTHRGVYAGLTGPSLETPAEVRFLRTVGADAVGFSTVCEVIAAVHGGMAVLALSTITNAHRPDRPQPVTLEHVLAAAHAAAPRINRMIGHIAARWPKDAGRER